MIPRRTMAAAKQNKRALPCIALFGDSLTQYSQACERALAGGSAGWGDCLAERFARRADVINRGCTQYNTRAALMTNLVPSEEQTTNPRPVVLATIWFGANDSCDAKKDPAKHVPLTEYSKNLQVIYERVKRLTDRIIFITPPPIRESVYYAWRTPQVEKELIEDRKNETLEKYAASCVSVAKKLGAPCINLFEGFQGREDELLSSEDGLHLSAKGDRVVMDLLWAELEKSFPELIVKCDPVTNNYSNSASTCPGVEPFLPWWDQIDTRNYRSQLASLSSLDEDDDDLEELAITWPARPAVVFLGDSITQQALSNPVWCNSSVDSPEYAGWADVVAARYVRRLDTYNRGLSGYNTRWALAAFDNILPSSDKRAFPVELVTICFGANDAADVSLNPSQGITLNEFRNNIEELVRRCKTEWNARRVVVIGCPPVDKEKYLAWRRRRPALKDKTDEELLDRTFEYAKKYSVAAEQIAKKHNVPFLDVFHLFGGHDYASYLSDGLHLSPKGNFKLGDALLQLIDRHWPEMKCTPDTLRRKYGFFGSVCRAFPPEQHWFTEIQAALLAQAADEEKQQGKTKPKAKRGEENKGEVQKIGSKGKKTVEEEKKKGTTKTSDVAEGKRGGKVTAAAKKVEEAPKEETASKRPKRQKTK